MYEGSLKNSDIERMLKLSNGYYDFFQIPSFTRSFKFVPLSGQGKVSDKCI